MRAIVLTLSVVALLLGGAAHAEPLPVEYREYLALAPAPAMHSMPMHPMDEVRMLRREARLAAQERAEAQAEAEANLLEKQELLGDLGWYQGQVDGIRGPLTEKAIERFSDAAEVEPGPEALLVALAEDDAPEAPPPPAPAASTPASSGGIAPHWIRLAECESGNWINGGASFEAGSARWQWAKPGVDIPSWGTTIHHGGLQHHPDTWRWVAGDLGLLDRYPFAYDAPPEVQVQVATEVQRRQGWKAWPVCSKLVGLR